MWISSFSIKEFVWLNHNFAALRFWASWRVLFHLLWFLFSVFISNVLPVCSSASTISSSSTSSSNLTHQPPVTSFSSSSDSEDSLPPPLTTSLGQSEQRKKRRNRESEGEEGEKEKKRRRQNHRRREINGPLENRDEGEEDAGRFVLRMEVSFGGGTEGGPLLLLCKYRRNEMEGSRTSQSETAISVFRRNGFRAPLLLPPHRWEEILCGQIIIVVVVVVIMNDNNLTFVVMNVHVKTFNSTQNVFCIIIFI